jgi:hypothetical protein
VPSVKCCGDDAPGSFTVNPWNSRPTAGGLTAPARVPAGMPKRADRVFRQLVDRKVPLANCQWRVATNDNRKNRQVRQVLGGCGQRSERSQQVIGASRNERNHQNVCFTRGPET